MKNQQIAFILHLDLISLANYSKKSGEYNVLELCV